MKTIGEQPLRPLLDASFSLNIMRLYRRARVSVRALKYEGRRRKMWFRANLRRMNQDRLFRFKRRPANATCARSI